VNRWQIHILRDAVANPTEIRYAQVKVHIPEIILRSRERWRQCDHAHWIVFAALYGLAANIPYWVASRTLDLLPLGWFCLESLGVGLVALFVPRFLASALLWLVMAADLVGGVSKTYYLSPTECLANVAALRHFSANRLAGIAAILALTLLVAAVPLFPSIGTLVGKARIRAACVLLAFGAIAVSWDYASVVRKSGAVQNPFQGYRPGDVNRFSDLKDLWIGRYPSIRLWRDEKLFGPSDTYGALQAVRSAMAEIDGSIKPLKGQGADRRPNIVLIVVESWGLEENREIRDLLIAPYKQPELTARYEVLQGTAPFFGPTVAGEARELCGSTMGSHIIYATKQELQACLPNRLMGLGYHSIALHGMDGQMFGRSNWYPAVGFQEQWFREEFRRQGLPDCPGAFEGTCDAAIADWIGKHLATPRAAPDFVYWMTLNSHLPVLVPSPLARGASCAAIASLAQETPLCSWYQLVRNVHDSISALAMTAMPRPAIFVVVGDHAPPFATPQVRDQFSRGAVPYVILLPRRASGPS